MKLKKIQINGFGNLENKFIELNDDINLVYGKNESGKSTVINFIKSIYYGINRNKAGQEFSEFERFEPWQDKDFSGKIEYEFGGKIYTVFRDFNRNNCKIYDDSGKDITNEFSKDKTRGAEVGVEHFGIDEETFLNTVSVMQNRVGVDISSQKTTIQKLTNMLQSGNENTSVEKMVSKLQKKLLDDVGSDRTRNKPINLVIKDLIDKKQLRDKLLSNRERKFVLENEKERINKQIENTMDDMAQVNKVIEVKSKYISLLQDKERTYELTLKIKEKEREEKTKKNKQHLKLAILTLVLLTLGVCGVLVYFKHYIWAVAEILIAIVGGILVNKAIPIEPNDTSISDFDVIKEELNKKEGKELDKLSKNGIKASYTTKKIQELNSLLIGLENKKNDLILETHKIKLEEEGMKENIERLSDVEEQLENLERKKEQLMIKSKVINIAIKALNDSYEELREETIPEMEKSIKEMIAKTTNENYNDVKYNSEEGLLIQNTVGEFVPVSKLSLGTIDQMYLGFRLGVSKKAKQLPIILDESFAFYDDERLENMIKTLKGLDRQIIIFTCSKREKEIFEKLNYEFNYVEI